MCRVMPNGNSRAFRERSPRELDETRNITGVKNSLPCEYRPAGKIRDWQRKQR